MLSLKLSLSIKQFRVTLNFANPYDTQEYDIKLPFLLSIRITSLQNINNGHTFVYIIQVIEYMNTRMNTLLYS